MNVPSPDRPALEGGTPVRERFLPFFVPDITEREIDEVAATLREGWLTYGPRTRRFADRFAERLGAGHAIPTSSCTAGLFLSLRALGVGPGDEIITSALTFTSTVNVILHCGARPVLVDVETETFGPDPERIREAITPRTRAVVAVHYGGQPCRIEEILSLCHERDLFLVEDAAHSFDAAVGERLLGTFGDTTCFSFYATKNITTGEGGMVTTEDGDLAREIALLGFHGMDGDAWQRYESKGRWFYDVMAPGYKYNLTDVAAAMGLVQLERADAMRRNRTRVAEQFLDALAGLADVIELPGERPGSRHTWHLFVVRLRLENLDCTRDRFIEALAAENIGTSVHFIPIHHHVFYKQYFEGAPPSLPATEDFFSRCVSLPIYSGMSEEDVADVIRAVHKLAARYRKRS